MRETDQFVFFFGKQDLYSNWYPCRFSVRGVEFNCAEQMMMYAKAVEFGDTQAARKILATADPAAQKKLGRAVRGFDKARWDAIARKVVYAACRAKFTQNPNLLEALLGSAPRRLVEASPYDTLWGVGLAAQDPRILDPAQWRGTNWLGEVLTRLRADLQARPVVDVGPPERPPAP